MEERRCVTLDTRAFDQAIEKKDSLIKSYQELNERYDGIVSDLLSNWKGKGADAFARDAKTVRANITGIFDILKIMCDTLVDCKAIFLECDQALGTYNRDPNASK